MRALAVVMMVQGHTIDVLLSDGYRSFDNLPFAVWNFLRGLTAPIFLFTAGTVFIFLFRSSEAPFHHNPRVLKGMKRFLLLVAIGYLLKWPTASLFDFGYVTAESWKVFYAIDALQLIGVGLILLMFSALIAERLKIGDYLVLSAGGLFFFAAYPLVERVNWANHLPLPVAGYLYAGSGSNFPLFPWVGYVLLGGVLGSYLANGQFFSNPGRFSRRLLLSGLALVGIYHLLHPIAGDLNNLPTSPLLISLRLGSVLVINALISMLAVKLVSIPRTAILIGRNTLLIYVAHLVILYGSAWNLGINQYFNRGFNAWQSAGAAVLMVSTMIGMIVFMNRATLTFREAIGLYRRYQKPEHAVQNVSSVTQS